MNNFKSTLKNHPILTALIVMFGFLFFQRLTKSVVLFNSDLTTNLIGEGLWALIILFLIAYINGFDSIKFSTKGFGYALKVGWYFILVNLVLGIFLLVTKLNNSELVPDLYIVIPEILIFLLFVGLLEEGIFRGLMLSAFLAKDGRTFSGVLKAIIISSLLFGFAHIFPDIFTLFSDPASNTLATYGQMFGKILQTGIVGFILAVIYVGNHNLWSVALIHSLTDLFSAGFGMLFKGTQVGNYVNSSNSSLNMIIYAFIIILLLPGAIYAYIQLKHIPLPQWGLFKEEYHPLNVKKVET